MLDEFDGSTMAHLAEAFLIQCKMRRLESAVTVQRVRRFLSEALGSHWGMCDVEKHTTGEGAMFMLQWTGSLVCMKCEKSEFPHTHAVIVDQLSDGSLAVSRPEEADRGSV